MGDEIYNPSVGMLQGLFLFVCFNAQVATTHREEMKLCCAHVI